LFSMHRPTPTSTLLPYTTLFRSLREPLRRLDVERVRGLRGDDRPLPLRLRHARLAYLPDHVEDRGLRLRHVLPVEPRVDRDEARRLPGAVARLDRGHEAQPLADRLV